MVVAVGKVSKFASPVVWLAGGCNCKLVVVGR